MDFRFLDSQKQGVTLISTLADVSLYTHRILDAIRTRTKMEGDERCAVAVLVASLPIPRRTSWVLVSLLLRLERGGTATMVARFSGRRAGQKLLSTTLLHQRWCNLVPLQRSRDDGEIPSDEPRQRQPGPSVQAASGNLSIIVEEILC